MHGAPMYIRNQPCLQVCINKQSVMVCVSSGTEWTFFGLNERSDKLSPNQPWTAFLLLSWTINRGRLLHSRTIHRGRLTTPLLDTPFLDDYSSWTSHHGRLLHSWTIHCGRLLYSGTIALTALPFCFQRLNNMTCISVLHFYIMDGCEPRFYPTFLHLRTIWTVYLPGVCLPWTNKCHSYIWSMDHYEPFLPDVSTNGRLSVFIWDFISTYGR
jgi:hypothetical protein